MFRRCLPALPFFLGAFALAQAPSDRVLQRYRQILETNPVEGTALDRLWDAYSKQGATADLIREYEGSKTFPRVMIHGHLLRKAGDDAAARTLFEKALELDSKSALPLLAIGHLEKAAGRHAQAAAALEKAVAILPDDSRSTPDALMDAGSEWLAAGDAEKAVAAWEKIVAIDPRNVALRRQLADAYAREHLAERALPHLHFVVEHGAPQERAQAWQQISELEQTRGNQDAAIDALEKAIAGIAPGNWFRAEAQSQLIRLHQRYHRTPALEEKWKKYAAGNPRDLGAYLQLIDLYARLGDLENELEWLDKLCALAPKHTDYRTRLARLLARTDRLDRAVALYDELLAAQPRNADLFFERARLLVRRGQAAQAGEEVAKFVAADRTDESLRGKALEFYETNRLFALAEKQLAEDAAKNGEDAVAAHARFLFSRGRDAEARAALARLIDPKSSPTGQAAAHFKIAQILKAQNDVEGAIASTRAAIALGNDAREFHFLLGELESSRADYPAAQAAFDRAYALSTTPADRIEADQRLYESLRNQQKPEETRSTAGAPRRLRGEAAEATSAAAQGYLLNLRRQAVELPTEEAWLRVARWQQWSRNLHQATEAANRALAVNPSSIAAHDFLASLNTGDAQSPLAARHLRELIRLDPANEATYLSRLGHGELQTGRIEEALKIFQQIVDANPGELGALADLSLAQQRAEKWTGALETVKKIHALSPASRRRDSASALLRIYDRLAMRQEAADLLLEQVDAADDLRMRFTLFHELLGHCARHGLLGWLRDEFTRRRSLLAGDYFTEMALGRVLKEQGEKEKAFELLADAALSAPDQGESLPELVREAEDLRKLETAIELQARLVRIVPQTTPAGLERLAQLQEKNLDPEAAGKTWEQLVRRFPREVTVLDRAADFQRRWGHPDLALAWLERLRALDPGNVRAALESAGVALDCAEPDKAAAAMESVLSQTSPPPPDEPIRFPGVRENEPGGVAIKRGTAPASGPREIVEIRETAIRQLGKIIAAGQDADAKFAWIARWKAAGRNPGERLLALLSVGASGGLLDEIEAILHARPGDNRATEAFVSLAFQTHEFDRLGAWLRDPHRTSSDRTLFIASLDRHLDAHDRGVDPGMMTALFPPEFRQRRWEAADSFRRHGLVREAAELAGPVFDEAGSLRAAYGLELAGWHLLAGEIEEARKVLRRAIEEPADSYGAPVFEAQRTLFRLLPPSRRREVFDPFLASLDAKKHPLHAALSRALIAGLRGDRPAAEEQLQLVLDSRSLVAPEPSELTERPGSAAQFWDFILLTGRQLQAWELDDQAEFLWAKALEDPAWIRLQIEAQGEQVRERIDSARVHLAAVRLLHADRWEFDETLGEFSRSFAGTRPEAMLRLAETLEGMSASPRAIEIYRRLWESEPSDPQALRNLRNACRSADDGETLELVLRTTIESGHHQANEAAQRDLVFQLVDVLEARGDLDGARRLLMDLDARPPRDPRVAMRLAHLHERAGEPALAEAAYRSVLAVEPARTAARVALASLLDARGDAIGAIEILERGAGADIDTRLAPLYLKTVRVDEAVTALERIPAPGHVPATLNVVEELMKKDRRREARLVLRSALARGADAQINFPLQSRMIELLMPGDGRAPIERELRQLEQMADEEEELRGAYFDVLARETPRLGIEDRFLAEVRPAWKEGEGSIVAGVVLLDWQMEHDAKDEAAATWNRLAARPDLDDRSGERAAAIFERHHDEARRVEALEKLVRIDPATVERFIDLARALEGLHRHAEAVRVAEQVAARAVLPTESLPPAAELFSEIGEKGRARELYAEAVESDPTARDYPVHLAYAHLLVETRQFEAAKNVLKNAFRNPANTKIEAVVEWLTASGRAENAASELGPFHLSPRLLEEVHRMLARVAGRTRQP